MEEKNKEIIDFLDIPIGKIETKLLMPARVKVLDINIKNEIAKDGKVLGDKVYLICKHPERETPIEISKVAYLKDRVYKVSNIWLNLDVEKEINRNSALAFLLKYYKVPSLRGLIKLDGIMTELDNGYLIIKAY